mmetsp:Transcript_8535/g.10493  ORF Transcript_8535/g.10493 Transcript_8535/m.10493 type:complete len:728 (-) Transcript_8535:214-2397(-)
MDVIKTRLLLRHETNDKTIGRNGTMLSKESQKTKKGSVFKLAVVPRAVSSSRRSASSKKRRRTITNDDTSSTTRRSNHFVKDDDHQSYSYTRFPTSIVVPSGSPSSSSSLRPSFSPSGMPSLIESSNYRSCKDYDMNNNVRTEVIRFDYEVTFEQRQNIDDGLTNLERTIFDNVANNFLDCGSRRELMTDNKSTMMTDSGWHLMSINSFPKDVIDAKYTRCLIPSKNTTTSIPTSCVPIIGAMTVTTCSTCPSPARAILQHIRRAMLQRDIVPPPDIVGVAFLGQRMESPPPAVDTGTVSSSIETPTGEDGGSSRRSALLVGGLTVIVVCLGIGIVLLLQLIKCRKFQSRIRRKRFDEDASEGAAAASGGGKRRRQGRRGRGQRAQSTAAVGDDMSTTGHTASVTDSVHSSEGMRMGSDNTLNSIKDDCYADDDDGGGGVNNRGFRVLEIIGEEFSTSTATTNCHRSQDKLSVETSVSVAARAAAISSPLSSTSSMPDENSDGNDLLGLSVLSNHTDTPSSHCDSLSPRHDLYVSPTNNQYPSAEIGRDGTHFHFSSPEQQQQQHQSHSSSHHQQQPPQQQQQQQQSRIDITISPSIIRALSSDRDAVRHSRWTQRRRHCQSASSENPTHVVTAVSPSSSSPEGDSFSSPHFSLSPSPPTSVKVRQFTRGGGCDKSSLSSSGSISPSNDVSNCSGAAEDDASSGAWMMAKTGDVWPTNESFRADRQE